MYCFLCSVRENTKSVGRHFGLKLNSTHQLVVCLDVVIVLGGSVQTVRKNTESLVVASPKWTRSKC